MGMTVGYNDMITLEDYNTEELKKELKNRGLVAIDAQVLSYIESIYFLRRNGDDYNRELDRLIDLAIGRY